MALEPISGDPGDEHVEKELPELPRFSPMNWYRDEAGYMWPTPGEGRVLVEE